MSLRGPNQSRLPQWIRKSYALLVSREIEECLRNHDPIKQDVKDDSDKDRSVSVSTLREEGIAARGAYTHVIVAGDPMFAGREGGGQSHETTGRVRGVEGGGKEGTARANRCSLVFKTRPIWKRCLRHRISHGGRSTIEDID